MTPSTLNCVICSGARFSIPSSSSSDNLDEKLVQFFLQKFLNYPLLPAIELEYSESDKSSGDFLGHFVKSYGAPTGWIWFCPSCLPMIQEARDLYHRISRIEAKLNSLRSKVEAKVVETFETDGEKRKGSENNIFCSARQTIFESKIHWIHRVEFHSTS